MGSIFELGEPTSKELIALLEEERDLDAMIRFATFLPEDEPTRTFLEQVDDYLDDYRPRPEDALTVKESREMVLARVEEIRRRSGGNRKKKKHTKAPESASQRLLSLVEELPHLAWVKEKLNALEDAEGVDKIRLAMLGVFSSGKSSLINALLGEDDESFLPVGNLPVTAALIEIHHGPDVSVTKHYKDGHEESISLEAFRGLSDQTKLGESSIAEDVERLIVTHPSRLLERFTLYDTPGFNSGYELHELVTEDVISKADVVLWIFNATKAGSITDANELPHIESSVGKTIGVLNRIDQIRPRYEKKPERWREELDGVIEDAGVNFEELIDAWVPVSAFWMRDGHEASGKNELLSMVEGLSEESTTIKAEAKRKRREELDLIAKAAVELVDEEHSLRDDFEISLLDSLRSAFERVGSVMRKEGPIEEKYGKAPPARREWPLSAKRKSVQSALESAGIHAKRSMGFLRNFDQASSAFYGKLGRLWTKSLLAEFGAVVTDRNASYSFCSHKAPSLRELIARKIHARIVTFSSEASKHSGLERTQLFASGPSDLRGKARGNELSESELIEIRNITRELVQLVC